MRLITLAIIAITLLATAGADAAIQPDERIVILEIWMMDTTSGWGISLDYALYARVVRTQDGGITWHNVTPPGWDDVEFRGHFLLRDFEATAYPLGGPVAHGVFLDPQTAWVVTAPEDIIWYTRDGGVTWGIGTWPDSDWGSGAGFASFLDFVDAEHGWRLLSHGSAMHSELVTLYRTTDGGASWAILLDGESVLDSCFKTGMDFADADTGWITRHCAARRTTTHVTVTHDGGATWEFVALPPPPDRPDLFDTMTCGGYDPHVFTPESGLLVVLCTGEWTSAAYRYATVDGGQTWHTVPIPTGQAQFIDMDTGWIVRDVIASGLELFRTLDSGVTWTWQTVVPWHGRVRFVDVDHGWVVAQEASGPLMLLQTTDGGRTWTVLEPRLVTDAQ